jgi:phosphatidylinositol alpha-mannosyltransferase
MSDDSSLDIALLNFAYWPEVQRGNERIIHDLAVALAGRGNSTTILTSHSRRPSHSVEEGVSVRRSWRPPEDLLRLRKIQTNLTHVPFSYLALLRLAPQVAHSFFATDALASVRWATRTDRPAIFTMTGIPERANVSSVRGRMRILEEVTTKSDAVTVLSKAARDGMWRWLGVEPKVIYPAVDLTRFTPGQRAAVPTIACAADPSDQRKRVDLLIRAFTLVRRDRPDAQLLLVRPTDPQLAARLTATEGVVVVPKGPRTAAQMFQQAWTSALTSYDEAFGLVIVESLACGTPVVGARSGAIPEIIDRQSIGSLFDGDDERDVADALLTTLDLSEEPETPGACRARASDFSVERSAETHTALYRELLAC